MIKGGDQAKPEKRDSIHLATRWEGLQEQEKPLICKCPFNVRSLKGEGT